jgi:hypothetical protein
VAVVSKPRPKIPRIRFGAVQPISLTTENWNAVEAAYGRSLSEEVRSQILQVTNQFLQFADAEKNIGDMDDAIQRAQRLRESAQRLVNAISERPMGDITRDYVDDELALSYVRLNRELVCKVLGVRSISLAARKYVSETCAELQRFVDACDLTLEELNWATEYDYWPGGAAWDEWIRQLTGILRSRSMPTGARKDKSDSDASPFARLVHALQTRLPREHIRAQNLSALPTAIFKARKESKPFVAPGKAGAAKTGRNTKNSAP